MVKLRRGFLIRFLMLMLGALVAMAPVAEAAMTFYPAGPRGTLGISHPTISQQLVLAPGEQITEVRMLINGTAVQASWDSTGRVFYTPPQPLPEGEYTVDLTVRVRAAQQGQVYEPLVSRFTFRVAGGAIAGLPSMGPEEGLVLAQVNALRKAVGLSPLTYNTALGAAARGHASYLTANRSGGMSHYQTQGQPLFFGQAPGDRARYYGYSDSVSEVIHFVSLAEEAVDGWMETLYHRIPLVHPATVEMGYGVSKGTSEAAVLKSGSRQFGEGVSRWPYPGQTGVPTSWSGLESPDPLLIHPGTKGPVGYTITLTFGQRPKSLKLTEGRLVGPTGNVEVLHFDPVNDPNLDDTIALIPRHPLSPGATYRVELAGRVDYGSGEVAFSERWSFTTALHHPPDPMTRSVTTRSGDLTRIRVEGTGFAAGMRVFLGGLPVQDVTVESPTVVSFMTPRGHSASRADLLLVSASGHESVWSDFFTGQESFRIPASGSALTSLQVDVAGRVEPQFGYRHVNGSLLIPETVLQSLGMTVSRVDEIGRTVATAPGVSIAYAVGRTTAWAGTERVQLGLPVRVIGGVRYFSPSLLDAAGVARTAVESGKIVVRPLVAGLSDLSSHWARDPVAELVQAGVVNGFPDGTYRPEETLTRSAFVKMLVAAQGLALQPNQTGGLTDVTGHWSVAQGYLGAAVSAGIVLPSDYLDRKFEPEKAITREEIAVMVVRSMGLDQQARSRQVQTTAGLATIGSRTFVDAATWASPGYVALAVEREIITGVPREGNRFAFEPSRSATRAEAAVMVLRRLKQL